MIEIKHKYTGKVIKVVEAETLGNANLRGADLRNANLRYANLRGAKTRMCKVNFSSDEYEQAKQFIEGLKL